MASTLDIYNAHFGFDERPFTLVPNPTFLFWSKAHRRAATVLEFGILTQAPITVLTGEVGSGKTTLLRHLLRTIDSDVTVGLVSNAFGDRQDLMHWILQAYGLSSDRDEGYVALFRRFQDFVIQEYAAGRRVILIFDEAQNLSREALEEVRMLTNINADEDVLLQLILVGQPELRDIIMRPDMVQLAQRVASSFFLPAMTRDTTSHYIAHRLTVAGGAGDLFEEDAVALVHEMTSGIPRLVNQLCDFALLYSFEEGAHSVTKSIVHQVLNDGIYFGGAQNPLVLTNAVAPADTPPSSDERTKKS